MGFLEHGASRDSSLGGPGKPRPAGIVQTDALPSVHASVVIGQMKSACVDAPDIRVAIDPTARNGLKVRSQVMADKPVTVRRERIVRRMALVYAMPYTPILATLGYILSSDRTRVLMIHRNSRADDLHLGKYNGLGGKLEANEDVVAGMRREIREEAGIECLDLTLRGTISWPGFGKRGEDWFGFLFVVTRFSGEPFERNPEGELEWVDVDTLGELPLWEGDRLFLDLVFDADPRQFHGVMPYHESRMVSWAYSRT